MKKWALWLVIGAVLVVFVLPKLGIVVGYSSD